MSLNRHNLHNLHNLFDQLVDEALANQKNLGPLRVVVEKELLQHDILREMNNAGFLSEMRRFLPMDLFSQTPGQPTFWAYLTHLIQDLCLKIQKI